MHKQFPGRGDLRLSSEKIPNMITENDSLHIARWQLECCGVAAYCAVSDQHAVVPLLLLSSADNCIVVFQLFWSLLHDIWTHVNIAFVHSHACAEGVGFTIAERVLFLPSVGICVLLDVVATDIWLLCVLSDSLPSAECNNGISVFFTY